MHKKRGRKPSGQGETLYLNQQWLSVFRLAGGNDADAECLEVFQAIAAGNYDQAIALLEKLKS